ncbi:teichoic acid transport system ATP-binding protein [Motilibacter rhizosphaerae]|uniref:Teichoic acid transport system ATP-binding protein n=1 Tax=Motilibacter rhizosphaerae TaxID=598652 RepID=A0A4Q7NTS4_9ACTN|nr:ABC transporter ATP-binding protein [Motilibacter rhizosphaerae]RZS90218.1 teichoic acid transport system ATP-binding protein [Motilibacter rhizosphaerae]
MLSVSDLQARRTTHAPAISIEDLSITYRVAVERPQLTRAEKARLPRQDLKQRLAADLRQRRGREVYEVEALKGVSVNVMPGAVLGVVGANGAGKSTLMRAVAGILPPTKGRITVRGRVSTLLALGVGFNGQLSGRENILLGGLAAGLSRQEIERRFEEIADFTGVPMPILERPMRTYSSGQYSRVAFAVAVHMEPDVLIVDEALSAGDAKFKQRAEAKMNELVVEDTSRTVLLVTHGLASIRKLCNEAIWLHEGKLMKWGQPGHIVRAYEEFMGVQGSVVSDEDL